MPAPAGAANRRRQQPRPGWRRLPGRRL